MDFAFGFNVETFAGVALAVTALIGLAKKFLKDKIKGKEPFLALLLPLAVVAVSKAFLGNFEDVGWFAALAFALGVGLSSKLVHDGISNPVLKPIIAFVLGMLKKKERDPVKEAVEAAKKADAKGKPAVELDEFNQPKKKE